MKQFILAFTLTIIAHSMFGQVIPIDRMMGAANHFMQIEHAGAFPVSSEIIVGEASFAVGYLLHYAPSGFIILSASERVDPVVGYDHYGSCDLPEREKTIFFDYLGQDIQARIAAWDQTSPAVRSRIAQLWTTFLEKTCDSVIFQQWPPANTTPTGGWLATNWVQTSPYNAMCPMDLSAGARSVVGCPATAMAQILNFHRKIHHTRLNDSDDYYHSYGAGNSYWIDDDYQARSFPCFDTLNVRLEEIENTYNSGGQLTWPMKAALSFACGVTAHQVYTSQVSGTFGLSQALMSFERFGYAGSKLVNPEDTTFNSMVAENIKVAQPVQLGLLVENGSGGHNVVADGYNTNEFYHFNFGWGGSANGWYTLPPTSIPYDLTVIEGAVLDIKPVVIAQTGELPEKRDVPVLFPNPVNEVLWVTGLKGPVKLSVYTPHGKLVLTTDLSVSVSRIPVSHLPPGSYIYRIREAGEPVVTGGLIKSDGHRESDFSR